MRSEINFHIHTDFSDGGKSVLEVVEQLKADGVRWFAITDHDNVGANLQAKQLAVQNGLNYINGVELSCAFSGELGLGGIYACHIVGLDFELEPMQRAMSELAERKQSRYFRLFDALKANGFDLNFESIVHNGTISRMKQLAREIAACGYAQSIEQAYGILKLPQYQKYLQVRPTLNEGIKLIHDCGGKAIWAHPFGISRVRREQISKEQVKELLCCLISYGIDGLEAYYQQYTKEQTEFLIKIADEHNLAKSIATDFHAYHSTDPRPEQLYYEQEGVICDNSILQLLKLI